MARSGGQHIESVEELGVSVADYMPGGGGRKGVDQNFQGGGSGGVAVRGGDVGTYPEDGAGPGEIPAWGHAPDHRETTAEKGGRALDVPPSEGGHDRGRV